MPAPVTAPGLPARRFWELEDGRLNLAALRPAETDLAQLLLIETLSGYGNDWFVIGVELPVGHLVSATSLVVTDTFGARTLLRPHGDHRLGVDAPAGGCSSTPCRSTATSPRASRSRNLLYLAPRLAQPVVGPVVEQVVLARDEQANLGWAVEQLLESPLQVGVELSAARPPEPPGDPDVAPRLPPGPGAAAALDPAAPGPRRRHRAGRAGPRVGARPVRRAPRRQQRDRAARRRPRRRPADPGGGGAQRRPRRASGRTSRRAGSTGPCTSGRPTGRG